MAKGNPMTNDTLKEGHSKITQLRLQDLALYAYSSGDVWKAVVGDDN